ncbi:MAG: GGDEF domain-containing protein [bacterium]
MFGDTNLVVDGTLVLVVIFSLVAIAFSHRRSYLLKAEVTRLATEVLRIGADRDNHQELSLIDPLTEVANRRAIGLYLQYDMERMSRYPGEYSLMFVDIDRFKAVNDTRGHALGDEILLAVAKSLELTFRESDTVGRYGGDEFVVLLPNADLFASKARAEDALKAVRDIGEVYDLDISLSIGIVTVIGGQEITLKALLDAADKGLYCAKNKGGNCWSRGFVEL